MTTVNFAQNPIAQNTLDSANKRSDEYYKQMLAKKAEYSLAQQNLWDLKAALNQKLERLQDLKKSQGAGTNQAQIDFNKVSNEYSSSDMNVDNLRGSLQDSIFSAAKAQNSASFANSVLG